MAIIIDTNTPADTEPFKLGAQRIRDTRTVIQNTLSQMFDASLVFLTKWVTATILQNDPSDDSKRAVGSDHIQTGAVITAKLATGVLSADTTGRQKMQNGFVLPAHLSFSVGQVSFGTYPGSNSAAAVVSGLPFQPKVVVITAGPGESPVMAGFSTEASGGPLVGDLHPLWGSQAIVTDNIKCVNAIQFNADGFSILSLNFEGNLLGRTHSYIALG